MSDVDVQATVEDAEEKAKQIPAPAGFRILCMVPKIEDQYSSGLVKADSVKDIESHSTVVLFVAKLGSGAYKDKTRFPDGPWCKEGDFVLVRAYSGTRLKIHGTEWRIINDDTVEGVVDDPRGLSRAY